MDRQKLEEGKYLITDLTQGDEAVASRNDFLSLNGDEIRAALNLITSRTDLSDQQKQQILANTWRIHYRKKPVSIEEFLTSEWIGPTADNLFPHVESILKQFWQPESQKRHLILGTAIGTGKALPDSAPVVIDEVPSIEIELEDGTILFFDEEEIVWYYDSKELLPIKAKDIGLVEVKDFPVPLNYYNMKIYNAKKIEEFDKAFWIESYDELIKFFYKFDPHFYEERNIYREKHHIIPRSEGGSDDNSNLILLPFFFHVKAHYLRAKEHEERGDRRSAFKNYLSVKRSMGLDRLPKKEVEVLSQLQFVSESIERTKSMQSKQFFIKKEGLPSFKIFEEEWDYYKSQGWEKGRNFNAPAGKRWVNKDNKNYYILKEELESYIDAGYSEGMYVTDEFKKANPKRASYSTLGTKWVNKEGKRRCVSIDDLDEYLSNGWVLGSDSDTVKGQTWEWREEDKGRNIFTNGEVEIWAYECPEGFWRGKKTKGKHWYNNGKKMILADECPKGFVPGRLTLYRRWYNNGTEEIFSEYPPEGFNLGKLSTKKHWYTNGIESAQLRECPEGWWRGRTFANKKDN